MGWYKKAEGVCTAGRCVEANREARAVNREQAGVTTRPIRSVFSKSAGNP